MVTMTVNASPAGARQNAVREKRVYLRGENQKFGKAPRTAKQTASSLKVQLGCKDHNLVTLWMLTLGLNWQKGNKKDNASLTTALYTDLEQRGFHVEDTTWTAYRKVRNLRFFGLLTETIIFQRDSVQFPC